MDIHQFEERKKDHIRLSLQNNMNAGYDLNQHIKLNHDPLTEVDFDSITFKGSSKVFEGTRYPIFISSMTAGHYDSSTINQKFAKLSQEKEILFCVGSQRKELTDSKSSQEWIEIKNKFPKSRLIANIGISEVLNSTSTSILKVLSSNCFDGLIVHLNPLQEILQPEGNKSFVGALSSLQELKETLDIPLILKETGCGFSKKSFKKINSINPAVIDLAAYGGTHWGRVEGQRAFESGDLIKSKASKTYSHWGHNLPSCIDSFKESGNSSELWASGGMRNGLDAALAIALGSSMVGFAKVFMESCLKSYEELDQEFEKIIYELKMALFLTGHQNLASFKQESRQVNQELWSWQV